MHARAHGPGQLPASVPSAVRDEFPLLAESPLLHYLDNAATAHKPRTVIEAEAECYRRYYSPVHRGLYGLAETATEHYERARATVARFIGSPAARQLVFTRSATESINMVAQGWARPRLRPGDFIWVTRMEHHANFLPWQRVCQETGASLRIIELTAEGELDLQDCDDLFGARTRLIAVTHVSNVLGTINPIAQITERARPRGIAIVVDAAQSVSHIPIDVSAWDCDFLAFSAHKVYGPTGIGALYGTTARLDEMEPLLLGGGMVDDVTESASTWAPVPGKFEAGSPNLAGAVGFAAAVDFVAGRIGIEAAHRHNQVLTGHLYQALKKLPDVTVYGPARADCRSGIVAFNIARIHPHDVAQVAGENGVAIRAGHHCCLPLHRHLGIAASVRASVALYNTDADIDALTRAIGRAREIFG